MRVAEVRRDVPCLVEKMFGVIALCVDKIKNKEGSIYSRENTSAN